MKQSLARFLRTESAGGIVMLCAACIAILCANSAVSDDYRQFLASPLFGMSVADFAKDVLMAVFFLAVGMELKREMKTGFLATARQRTLPLIAALGGIAMPALLYTLINHGIAAHAAGWAIPTATDIAFALCVLSLLGKRVPDSAKIFLLAIAIYDDLAAIIIIALFYSGGLEPMALLSAAAVFFTMCLYNRSGGACLFLYLVLGAALWHFVHDAGIHGTVAGMLTGLLIPLKGENRAAPLNTLLHGLHPWVSFAILPAFAFVSAGVELEGVNAAMLQQPLPLGIALGLFFGKQLGIFGATYAAVNLGFAKLPAGSNWRMMYGISLLAGIGFTMSLFIAALAFGNAALNDAAMLGVLTGSLLSAFGGYAFLRVARRGISP